MAKQTIIVMSDSHGNRSIVEAIKEKYLGQVDGTLHNGDSELKSDDPVWEGIHVVQGNMDFYDGYPERLVTQLGPTRIIQTHGHLFQINFSFQKLDLWAQEEEADICLYGHLHIPDAWKEGRTLFVNPGSVSQPRGLIRECLYAKIEIPEETFASMDIVDVAKKEVGVIGLDFNLTEVLHKLVDDSFLSVVDEEGYFQGIITRKSILKAINSLMHNFSNEYEMIPK